MPKTPRFVTYQDKGKEYVIHTYSPRFVAVVTGKDTLELWEQWEDDDKEVSIAEAMAKAEKWIYFTRDKKKADS